MQMYLPGADTANFEPVLPWYEALTAPGAPAADRMRHLKALIESRPMPDRVSDLSLIVDNGTRHHRVLASRGQGSALAYLNTRAPFPPRLGVVSCPQIRLSWY